MDEIFDEIDLNSKLDFSVWKKLFKYVKPHKWLFIGTILCVICTSFLETEIFRFLADEGLGRFADSTKALNTSEFVWFLVGVFFMIVTSAVLNKFFLYLSHKLELNLYKTLTSDMFKHFQQLSYNFYDKYSVGWLISRITNDTSTLGEIISWGLTDIIWALFKLIFILIYMLSYSPSLTLIMLIIVPLLVVISTLFRRIIVKYFWKAKKLNSEVSSKLNEGISGAKTSKTLVLEEKNLEKFTRTVTLYKKTSMERSAYSTIYFQVIALLCAVGIGAMCYFGGINTDVVLGKELGAISVSTLYLFVSYSTSFFEPVLSISRSLNQIKMAQVSASRIFNILEVPISVKDSDEIVKIYGTSLAPNRDIYEPINGEIKFDHVTFSYDNNLIVLDDFNLDVKKGQSIALVGETGAGKSTIINLLCRFYEPTEGSIIIDGKDYRERSVDWLHSNLGYVMQSPHLFSGSIADNIKYGKQDATMEDIIRAAKAVNADDFINELEDGYNTEVGEGGNRLSQGQKQLISFARALIADPKILILDEATSSIDTTTEALIQKATNKILAGRTSFIVAHRLSTIVNSDMILVINGGKITEKGTHKELMELKGYYYKLYTNQFIEDQMKEMNVVN